MAAELLNALGPRANHAHLYNLGGSPFSLVTSPAPAQGNYRLRANGADNTRRSIYPSTTITNKAYFWAVVREWRQAATMTAGNIAGIVGWGTNVATNPNEIVAVGQSGGGWKVQIRDSNGLALATGATLYATGAIDRDFRVTLDGTNVTVEVDGVVELTYASTPKPYYRWLVIPNSTFSGQDTYWSNIVLCQSDSADDRPAVDIEIEKHVPNSNPGTYTDYGDQANCSDNTLGHYENWDDYNGSGGVNTADYNCADWTSPPTGTRGDEVSGLTNATHSNPTILGVVERAWCKQTGATKIRHRGSLYYSATFLGVEMAQFVAQTTWDEFASVFPDPPGGGAWSQTILDGMDGGHGRLTADANSYLHISGLAFESVSITADPPVTEESAALFFSPVM